MRQSPSVPIGTRQVLDVDRSRVEKLHKPAARTLAAFLLCVATSIGRASFGSIKARKAGIHSIAGKPDRVGILHSDPPTLDGLGMRATLSARVTAKARRVNTSYRLD
jgi:hypothetical protein